MLLQPVSVFVPVTINVTGPLPLGVSVIAEVKSPVFQLYVSAPKAVNTSALPAQIFALLVLSVRAGELSPGPHGMVTDRSSHVRYSATPPVDVPLIAT